MHHPKHPEPAARGRRSMDPFDATEAATVDALAATMLAWDADGFAEYEAAVAAEVARSGRAAGFVRVELAALAKVGRRRATT